MNLTPGDRFKYKQEYLDARNEWVDSYRMEQLSNYIFIFDHSEEETEWDMDEDDNEIVIGTHKNYIFTYIHNGVPRDLPIMEEDIVNNLERTQITETFVARKLSSMGIKINA